MAPDSTLQSGKDFEGKTVGSPALNDLNQLVISAWVDAHGGDPKTMHFVELPNSTAPAAIATHRVDGAVLLQPALAEAISTKQVKQIAPAYDAIALSFVFAAYFTSSDYAKVHPDIVAKFAKVLYEAAAYTNKHHQETAAMMADGLQDSGGDRREHAARRRCDLDEPRAVSGGDRRGREVQTDPARVSRTRDADDGARAQVAAGSYTRSSSSFIQSLCASMFTRAGFSPALSKNTHCSNSKSTSPLVSNQ